MKTFHPDTKITTEENTGFVHIVGRWFPSGFIQRLPTHAPGVEADEDQDVEKWTEDKVQHGHEEDGIVDYPDVKHVLEWQKND